MINHKPKKVCLDQKSQDWLDWRNFGIGASESAIIKMEDEYPYSSNIQKLWAVKTGVLQPEIIDNKYTQRGNELEPVARKIFNDRTGFCVEPECFEHPYYEFIKASMDGISEDGMIIAEIKCPSKPDRHREAIEGRIPENYYCQIQHQYLVTGAKMGYFVSYFPDWAKEAGEAEEDPDGKLDFKIIPVKPNYAYIEDLQRKLVKFWSYVEKRNLPVDDAFAYETIDKQKVGLINLSGYAKSGKDLMGKAFQRVYKAQRFAFADELKRVYLQMTGITEEELAENKEKHRPALVALGAGMRQVYPDVWLRGVYKKETGIFDAMDTYGACITDVRYVNEMAHGIMKAKDMEVPAKTIWMNAEELGIVPANEEELKTTSLIRDMADVEVINDMIVQDEKLRDQVFDMIVLRIYQGQIEIKVSDVVNTIRIQMGVGEDVKKVKSKKKT